MADSEGWFFIHRPLAGDFDLPLSPMTYFAMAELFFGVRSKNHGVEESRLM